MTNYVASDKKIFTQDVQAYAFLMQEGDDLCALYPQIEKDFFPHFNKLLKEKKFTGAKGQTLVIPCSVKNSIAYLICVGIGKTADKNGLEIFRNACATVIRTCQAQKIASVACAMPAFTAYPVSVEKMGEIFSSVCEMAHYKFDLFITKEEDKTFYLSTVLAIVDKKNLKKFDNYAALPSNTLSHNLIYAFYCQRGLDT